MRALLEATARDVPPGGVDSASGAGALDLAAALAAPPPPPEDPEPNDDTAQAARSRAPLRRAGPHPRAVTGRSGSRSDPRDGFRVVLRAGDGLTPGSPGSGPSSADLDLALWRPGTPARPAARVRPGLAVGGVAGPVSDERSRSPPR